MPGDDAFHVSKMLLKLTGMGLFILVVAVIAELVGIERLVENQPAHFVLTNTMSALAEVLADCSSAKVRFCRTGRPMARYSSSVMFGSQQGLQTFGHAPERHGFVSRIGIVAQVQANGRATLAQPCFYQRANRHRFTT